METPVYVDSPLAISATEVFKNNEDLFDDDVRAEIEYGEICRLQNEISELYEIPPEVQEKQEQIINNYEPPVQKERVPDLSDEVSRLEKKLNQKRLMMPFSLVLVIVILINIIWFLGVRFVIVPKYEEFTKVSDDLKKDYEDLKRKVNAIVGE